ncbi:MAG: hypothetical protein LWX08_15085, partial [Deltaproteobacteria bacterium]|nr:hypothetical protein [Deltaproteobacteria bacterium]
MDTILIQGTISGLKTAADIAKSMINLKSMSDVQSKVVELQSSILAAQSSALSANAEQFSMVDEIRTLKEEITRIKTWEGEKQRYQLHTPWKGTGVVYALKESMSNAEPPHYLCTKCYEDGKRMILQPRKKDGFVLLVCPTCNSEIHSGLRGIGNPDY